MAFFGLFGKKSAEEQSSLDKGLQKTKNGIFEKISRAIAGKSKVDADVLDGIEEALIASDIGVDTTLKIIDNLEERVAKDKFMNMDELYSLLRSEIEKLLNITSGSDSDKEPQIFDFSKKPYVIMVVGVNGVGKTTTTANIGIGLSKLGKKVIVIDTDLGLRNLDVVMGLENRIVYNLVDVIEGKCRLKQALIRDKRFDDLYLLPSAQTRDKTSVSPEQMKKLVDDLRDDFDYILLDCPAGIEQGFQNAIAGADRALVVTTPEVSAIRDADRIIGLLEASGIRRNNLLINRIRIDMVRRGDMMSVDDVTEILAVDLLGVIPDDEHVVIATNQGEPVVGDDCLAGSAYERICRRLLGEEIPIKDFSRPEGLFEKISGIFHRS